MTSKQFNTILSPILKIERIAEENSETLKSIEQSVISGIDRINAKSDKSDNSKIVGIRAVAFNTHMSHLKADFNGKTLLRIEALMVNMIGTMSSLSASLSDAMIHLEGIKESISLIASKQKKAKASGIDITPMGALKVGGFMILSAASLAIASRVMQFIVPVAPAKIATAILIAIALKPLSEIFVKVYDTIRGFDDSVSSIAKFAGNVIAEKKGLTSRVTDNAAAGVGASLAFTGISIIMMASTITISSFILSMIRPVSSSQFVSALLIGIALIPMSRVFSTTYKVLADRGIKPDKTGWQTLGMVGAAMVLVAGSIVAVAWALSALPPELVEPPELEFIINTGLMLNLYSLAASRFLKHTKGLSAKKMAFAVAAMPLLALAIVGVSIVMSSLHGMGGKFIAPPLTWSISAGASLVAFSFSFAYLANKLRDVSAKDAVKTVASMGLIALGIIGVAWFFQYLNDISYYTAPPVLWSIKAGVVLLAFSMTFLLISRISNKIKVQGMIKALGVIVIAAVAILATAWIFSYLENVSSYNAPPIDWSINAGLAVGIFALGMVGIGLAVSAATPVVIVLGALGIILAAGVIWVVAKIFASLADIDLKSVGDNVTGFLLAPVNGVIDALVRINNEIGVDNLFPLAGGIIAISAALVTLGGATIGIAAAGVASAIGNVATSIADGLAKFFGGEESKGPVDILMELVDNSNKIKALASPLKIISESMSFIALLSGKTIDRVSSLFKELNDYNFENQAESIESIATSYAKISRSSREINIEALQKTTDMFNALGYLASMGSDNALEKLGDKLIDAVQELANMISNFQGTVNNQQTVTGGFVDSLQDAVMSLDGILNSEVPQSNQAEIQSTIDESGIINAIDDLKGALMIRGIKIQEI